ERANDRIDRLAAERGQAVDKNDLAAELRGFERRCHAGRARADDADIRAHFARARALASDGFCPRCRRRSGHAYFLISSWAVAAGKSYCNSKVGITTNLALSAILNRE